MLHMLDTDILIDVSRGIKKAVTYLELTGSASVLGISAVTEMELIVGCQNKRELHDLDKFLAHFQIFPINGEISSKAVQLLKTFRLSHGLLIADAVIAATAIVANAPFSTKNQRDYRFIDGLDLRSY